MLIDATIKIIAEVRIILVLFKPQFNNRVSFRFKKRTKGLSLSSGWKGFFSISSFSSLVFFFQNLKFIGLNASSELIK